MKNIKKNRIAQLLLYLFVPAFTGCSKLHHTLHIKEHEAGYMSSSTHKKITASQKRPLLNEQDLLISRINARERSLKEAEIQQKQYCTELFRLVLDRKRAKGKRALERNNAQKAKKYTNQKTALEKEITNLKADLKQMKEKLELEKAMDKEQPRQPKRSNKQLNPLQVQENRPSTSSSSQQLMRRETDHTVEPGPTSHNDHTNAVMHLVNALERCPKFEPNSEPLQKCSSNPLQHPRSVKIEPMEHIIEGIKRRKKHQLEYINKNIKNQRKVVEEANCLAHIRIQNEETSLDDFSLITEQKTLITYMQQRKDILELHPDIDIDVKITAQTELLQETKKLAELER